MCRKFNIVLIFVLYHKVDDLDEKLDRLLGMYEDDRKKMQEQQQQIVVAAAAAAGQAVANHAALSNSGKKDVEINGI